MENTKISVAFVKAQKDFMPALKTNTNPHFKSKYVGLDGCIEAVIDALGANGIALMQKSHECDSGVAIETLFIHESGEVLSGGIMRIPAVKNDAQGYGSALTYARRYSLMAACGIAPEDDDGNAASKPKAPIIPALPKVELADKRQGVVVDVAEAVKERMGADDLIGAYEEYLGITDSDEKIALWGLLPSNIRTAIKKHGESLKS